MVFLVFRFWVFFFLLLRAMGRSDSGFPHWSYDVDVYTIARVLGSLFYALTINKVILVTLLTNLKKIMACYPSIWNIGTWAPVTKLHRATWKLKMIMQVLLHCLKPRPLLGMFQGVTVYTLSAFYQAGKGVFWQRRRQLNGNKSSFLLMEIPRRSRLSRLHRPQSSLSMRLFGLDIHDSHCFVCKHCPLQS